MRKIVAGLFITLDGVVEIPEEWMGPYFTPELGQAIGSMMAAQNAMLLGRVTYEMFAAHWPNQTGDTTGVTDYLNRVQKYVVSSTLTDPQWRNSTVLSGDPVVEVRALKEQGFTILLVEQNFRFASTVADHYYVMENGRIVDRFANAELEANLDKVHNYLGV